MYAVPPLDLPPAHTDSLTGCWHTLLL